MYARNISIATVVLVAGAAFLWAAPAAPDGGSNTAAPKRHVRLTKPWSELKDLTDQEKSKILDLHEAALEEIHKIEKKEHEDILTVLTDDQRKEVQEIEAKDKQQRRTRRPGQETTQNPSSESTGDSGK